MRVRIGPYKSWFGPYQLAEKIMFWAPKERDEYGIPCTAERVHRFGEWLAYGKVLPEPEVGETAIWGEDRTPTIISRFLSWIDSKKKRKIYVHIDRWDTWSMDITLGYIIRPMLLQLKERKQGAPFVDDEDVPEHLRSTNAPPKENEWDTDDNHFNRWDYVLDEMIFAFESIEGGANQDWEDQFTTGEYDYHFKKQDDDTSLMVQGPNHTAKTDWDGQKVYAKRVSNGFRLFGKYYESLWA